MYILLFIYYVLFVFSPCLTISTLLSRQHGGLATKYLSMQQRRHHRQTEVKTFWQLCVQYCRTCWQWEYSTCSGDVAQWLERLTSVSSNPILKTLGSIPWRGSVRLAYSAPPTRSTLVGAVCAWHPFMYTAHPQMCAHVKEWRCDIPSVVKE